MLFCMRWERNALAEAVPKDRKALSTGDSSSVRSRTFRCFGKPGVIGRGNSPSHMKTAERFVIHTNQPRTEDLYHVLSKLSSTTSRTAVFSLGQNSDSFLSNRMEVTFPTGQSANPSLVGELIRNH